MKGVTPVLSAIAPLNMVKFKEGDKPSAHGGNPDAFADVKAGKVKTVQGSEVTIATTGGVTVDKAKVIKTDIAADNGVIHVIDTVLMPK